MVSEVIYLGTSTRILVDLDGGYRLNVLEQNTGGAAKHDRRGEKVVASWSPSDVVSLAQPNR
jgi:putative spermidine/putrescine transport system ATP-binding protein